MSEQYNVDELFEGYKSFDRVLLNMKAGERKFFCLALPLAMQGKEGVKVAVPVQGYFNGVANKNPSFIIRCYEIPLSGGNPDFDNATFVGLVANSFVAGKIRECFTKSTVLDIKPNLLPDEQGKAFLFQLTRVEKITEFKPSSVSIKIPTELYEKEGVIWEELIESFNSMQEAMSKKTAGKEGVKEESTPWS